MTDHVCYSRFVIAGQLFALYLLIACFFAVKFFGIVFFVDGEKADKVKCVGVIGGFVFQHFDLNSDRIVDVIELCLQPYECDSPDNG